MDDFQVPVIVLFTKYDQFKRNIKMKLEDEAYEGRDLGTHSDIEVESVFNDHYLTHLGGTPPFFRLESEYFFQPIHTHHNFCPADMHKPDERCSDLIDVTANTLSGGVAALMFMAVQRNNLELSVRQAIKR